MINNFVKLEQAIELKDLDFDENCLAYYRNFKDKWDLKHIDNNFYDFRPISSYHFKAPLKSQVFKFFRDKYKIDTFIEKYDKAYIIGFVVKNKHIGYLKENLNDTVLLYFDTYEHAEDVAISTLIKMVIKEKNNEY